MEERRLFPGLSPIRSASTLAAVVGGTLVFESEVSGQQALRSVVEEDRNLQSRIQQSNVPFDAPITLGPVGVTAGLSLGLTYTDNSRNAGGNPESDFIVTPGFNVGMFYQVTDSSRLAFGVGLQYQIFTLDTRPDRLLITPNSSIAYDFQAGEVFVSVFDTFSFSSDALDRGDLVDNTNFGGINNTVGIRATFAPEPFYTEGGYSHFNFWATDTSDRQDLTRAAEQVFYRAGQIIQERTRWGLETTAAYIHYDVPIRSDLYQLSVGPYLEWQITEAWTLSGRVGWGWTEFEQNGFLPAPDDIAAPYLGLSIAHQWTENFSHNLSATREVTTGNQNVQTQVLEVFRFNYGLRWQVTELLGFTAGVLYEIGEQPQILTTENYDFYGFNFGFPFAITDRFTTAVSYQYRNRVSNIAGQSFDQNNVTLSLGYRF